MGIEINFNSSAMTLTNETERTKTTQPVNEPERSTNSANSVEASNEKSELSAGAGYKRSALEVEKMVNELNENQGLRQRNLELSVNDQLGKTIVKVIDSETGELIRQIPSEELVELAERVESQNEQSEKSVGYLIDSII